jgi:ankyrin repeat protein
MIFDLIRNKKFDELFVYIKNNPDIDLDIQDDNYNYLIQYMILYNNIKIVDYIIKNRTIRLDIIDIDGRSILYNPIKYNYIELLELILDYDNNSIGISILDVRDKIGYTGLHYCIIFNNISAFKLLYKYSDINITDINGNNIYNICLQYNRTNLLIYLLENEIKKQHNINHFTNINGESILQSAINYDDKTVINYIINNPAFLEQIINIKENEYGLTALHQTIVLHFNDISLKLIEHKADINSSDYLGNTPLHYCIIEKNYAMLDVLIKKNNLFYSELNMTGNTALHLLLEEDIINHMIADTNKYKYDIYSILLKMIENTDINIMNNNGDTILHLIVMKNLWTLDEIKNILINGKTHMNIFILNKNNTTPFDLVPNNMKDTFIDIVIESYYNILKNLKNNEKLTIEWEKYCANDDLTNLLKILKKSKSDKDISYYCKNKIKQQIVETKQSIPTYKELSLTIDSGIYVEGCFYTGSTIDILFGLLYLNNNYNNINLLLEYPLTGNKEIQEYYVKMGINYTFKMEFSNIEIVWSFMKLFYQTNFESILKNRINNALHYIIIPLGIEVSNGSHANMIIIDTKNKIIERFEPNGRNPPRGFYYNPNLLDTLLETKFNEIIPHYKYIKPIDYLPNIGFQLLETIEDTICKKIGDPNGFCAVWCVWWVDMKLKNPDIDSNRLATELIKQIKLSNKSFKKIIRNYSINIVKLRDEYLYKYNHTIDDWMNGNYEEDTITLIEQDILKKIN